MVKEIGYYNVDSNNLIHENGSVYDMTIFSKFNDNEEEIERKTIYFLTGKNCLFPNFKTDSEITIFLMDVKNNQKVKVSNKIVVDKIK